MKKTSQITFTTKLLKLGEIYKIPETAFNEFETSNYIKNYLNINNIKFESDIIKTGILVELAGKKDGKMFLP